MGAQEGEGGLSAGCSGFCFVFIFKLWREKRNLSGVFAFISISFHSPSFPPPPTYTEMGYI